MAGKEVGEVTTGPAVSFKKDGKSFVRFVGPGCGVAEVFGPKEFEAEFGMTFREFCDSLSDVPDDEADHVGGRHHA